MNRRNFIGLLTGIFVEASTLQSFAARFLSGYPSWNRLSEVFAHDLDAARAIGGAYLEEIPQESDADILAELIVQSDPNLLHGLDLLSEKSLVATLRTHIVKDFEMDNTIQIDGWVLSRTEARVCALCTFV